MHPLEQSATVEAPLTPPEEPIPLEPPRPTPEQRQAEGKAHRSRVPRSAHATWQPAPDRADPIALLEESSRPRLQHLIPIRYGRMLASPFAFFRGSPVVMATDLAVTPVSGIRVQVCGDAHLMNFGVYASPERNLLFDLNDFDETLPGPWEWDVKRLATSFVVAGRSYGIREADCALAARACARSYRKRLRGYSEMRLLDIWYSRVDAQAALEVFRRNKGSNGGPSSSSTKKRKGPTPECKHNHPALDLDKARQRNTLQALSRLAIVTNGHLRLVESPPLVCHVNDERLNELLRRFFRGYYASLQDDRRALVERYRFVDFALKVVGVGSVGTRCYIVLLDSSDPQDPLLLQIKEAQASVLEAHVGKSRYHNSGHRVVTGQRLMQSASDIFLGWAGLAGYHYYFRQLRDMKGTANLATMSGLDLVDYAALCGWVLARAHARSGDSALLSGYLGKSEVFDEAIATFASAYADQTEKDFEAFQAAVRSSRLPAQTGV